MSRGPYGDFTEATYRLLLDDVHRDYEFASFLLPPDEPHVLWRHDIDLSPHRALSLARIETRAGVRATYFIRVRSPFYNVFERPVAKILKEIGENHRLGLHADPGSDDVYTTIRRERQILELALEQPVVVVSLHNPHVSGLLGFTEPAIEGLVNVQAFVEEYTYVSDSGGSWRSPIHELLDPVAHPQLHVATHPEWWTKVAMNLDARIRRGLNGRKEANWWVYQDEINARFGAVSR